MLTTDPPLSPSDERKPDVHLDVDPSIRAPAGQEELRGIAVQSRLLTTQSCLNFIRKANLATAARAQLDPSDLTQVRLRLSQTILHRSASNHHISVSRPGVSSWARAALGKPE
jgi:hypothetical protein